jgi:AraC-like DNA-binding protein
MHNVIDNPSMYMNLYRLRTEGRIGGIGDVRVTQVGDFRGRGTFESQARTARSHDIHVFRSGSGTMTIGGTRFFARTGDVAVFFPGGTVEYRESHTRPWRYTWFTLEGRGAGAVLAEAGFTAKTPFRRRVNSPGLEPLFAELRAAYRTDSHSRLFPHLMAWRLVEALSVGGDSAAAKQTPVGMARELIETYGAQGVTLKVLCSRLGVSRTTLFRLFKAECGMSPKAYIDNARMEHAARLLRETPLTVRETGRQTGYRDPSYFGRAFRKRFGCSPERYRGGT